MDKNSYNVATQKAFVLFVLWGENFLVVNSKLLLQRFSTIKTSINYAACCMEPTCLQGAPQELCYPWLSALRL
mgnify:FL=1